MTYLNALTLRRYAAKWTIALKVLHVEFHTYIFNVKSETPEKWLGVTYKEDKSFVSERLGTLIEEGIYPKKLW